MSLESPHILPAKRSAECVFTSPPRGAWQGKPGRALRGPEGALALNIAPARWLLLSDHDNWQEEAIAAGALLFDTTGQWVAMEIDRAHPAVLAAVDIDSCLVQRECAAVSLLDAPALIASTVAQDRLLICIPASYADSFANSIRAVSENL
jgi:hypothetical protein